MKKILFSIILLLALNKLQTFAQTANDTTLALAIRASIQNFSNEYWYTFDKKKFNLNKDSVKLYQLVSSKILTKDYLYDHESSWNALTGEEYKHTGKRKWEKYNKSKSGVVDETGYWCNVFSYETALEEWKMFQKTGNCRWRDIKIKGNKISKINSIIVIETSDPSYLPWHPTILPSEILIGYTTSDCWRTPIALKYKKPRLNMVFISDSIRKMVAEPARFAVIEKLVNNPNLVASVHVQAVVQDSTKFSLIVSKRDTILFGDFVQIDGDKISVYFDGKIVEHSISIERKPYQIPIDPNINVVEIVIEDEGLKPPCTLEIFVNDKQYSFYVKKGEKITLLRL
ncbi:MAG: hypothetical protein MUD00_00105 [Candidatus Pacebacteria bacterium]|jgi:hypothetical protein|nr:hypothetical protein [Candidatus Paceibacterota bacterium]